MRRLIAIVNDEEAPYGAQIAAANAVLDRAFGQPKQELTVEQQGRSLEDILRALYEKREAEKAQERAEGERPPATSE